MMIVMLFNSLNSLFSTLSLLQRQLNLYTIKMEKKLKKYLKNGKFENVSKITSKTMSSIRGKKNKSTELPLKMGLVRNSISGWKMNYRGLKGSPDFYFEKSQLAVFVDGCFWHSCPKCGHIPNTRSEFWAAKLNRTKERDRKTNSTLKSEGIKVLRIWEHELKDKTNQDIIIKKIQNILKNTELK